MELSDVINEKKATTSYKSPPKKHKGLTCKKCGVSSYYIKDKCWLCGTPFKAGK